MTIQIFKGVQNQELVLKVDYDKLAAECAAWHAEPSFVAMMEALDVFFADEEVPERAMLAAYKILKPKRTTAVDAAISEFKAQGVDEFKAWQKDLAHRSRGDRRHAYVAAVIDAELFAAKLRAGVKS